MVATPRRSSGRSTSPTKKNISSNATKRVRYCRKCTDIPRHEQRLCPQYKRTVRSLGEQVPPLPSAAAASSDLAQFSTIPVQASPVPLDSDTITNLVSMPISQIPAVPPENPATSMAAFPLDPALFRPPHDSSPSSEGALVSQLTAIAEDFPLDPALSQPPCDSAPRVTTTTHYDSNEAQIPGTASPEQSLPSSELVFARSSSTTPWATPTRASSSQPTTPSSSSTPSTPTRSSPIATALSRRRKKLSSSSTGSSRIRASLGNPVFGKVEGAYRGSRLFDVARTRPLKPPRTRRVAKHFHERMNALLTRCEDLAHETGCWLYISAQLPTSNVPFTHFSSERLRAEGGTILDEVHDASDRMYDTLVSARRRDNAQLASEIIHANRERDAAREAEATAIQRASQLEAVLREAGVEVPT
ncbi:hypothetical protein VNI00_018127 [Paramarasmius palmivorus]|uniref:Uncharacterized protein n=1 Tax=Paramarasmius palmivorus TaxID=297713 RepID=A0AAW0B0W0_9AGAR